MRPGPLAQHTLNGTTTVRGHARAQLRCRCISLDEVGRLERHEGVELVVEEFDGVLFKLVDRGKFSRREHFFSDLLVPDKI